MLGAFGCSSADPTDDADDGDDGAALVDARLAALGELAAVVRIDSDCTASKIGPRLLLTAAHCIRDAKGDVKLSYVAGREIPVLVRMPDGKTNEVRAAIEFAKVHPRVKELCSVADCNGSAANAKRDAPDVAVIKTTKELVGVALMPIDGRPTAPGETVIETGFGCTDGAFSRKGDDDQLRTGPTTVVDANATVHEGSPVNAAEAADLANVYVYTAGPAMKQNTGAGLCPGDSGGPLVRLGDRGRLSVIGVNASYTFRYLKDDPVGRAVTNWHARVDRSARYDVLAWLKAQGATIAQ
jgi:hypothetical protein